MNLLKVATGLFWLEIPEKDLYLMCGCPMDSIKHLENKNIIHRVDRDDCFMETGPNAILLSDLPVQNGYFCNLAEFPILHMMYKQGMALPDHPGNKGQSPWLIGVSDQVESQKNYIFRGNYGLSTREEFKEAGCVGDEIDIMWNLKMKFNFNTILDASELVETTVVDTKEVELRPEVFLKRTGLNRYTLRYNDESIDIDLNLDADELYEPPYHLNSRKIDREYFSIIHVGEGNGWDNARPCMGSIISYQGKIYLIDAGPNIEYSLNAMGLSVNNVDGIFHTHIHDDHFAGLTYLIMADHKIKYYATSPVMATARKKLSALMGQDESMFDSVFCPEVLDCGIWNNIDGLEIKPLFSPHPVETSVFYFRVLGPDGYKSYAHLADVISDRILKNYISDNPKEGISQEFYDKVWKDYLEYADIKKIDVGGGLIHGDAADFKDDPSALIILSHLDRTLNNEEKEIGSNVEFGSQHVLIASNQNYSMNLASKILNSYFPETPEADQQMLLNTGKVSEFPAGTIIAKDSTKMDNVFLIISGTVDYIFSETGTYHEMTSGSTVGLMNGLWDEPIKGTYRASAHVEALVISKDVLLHFLKKNNEIENLKKVSRRIFDLRCSYLFGSRISNTNLVKLAQRAGTMHLLPGDVVPGGWPRDLYLIKKGKMEIRHKGKTIGKLGKWESWGGYPVYPIWKDLSIEAVVSGKTSCEFYRISFEVLKDIPVVQWKLYQLWSCWGAHS
ncbi:MULTISPECIES: cyclic nucleotide-binding domain-containing protein [unclassified Oceanispirochaeta]|nr:MULTISPECIES: cyclic nucleotide-binding domain-containing protein [unclassified Oceanispirochaeta]MBF9018421.1 cyclic nucleotide-binding domain-containing protein [Oceanispirochaeta sp. M2]NPD74852.1 cyclic nucleotide-binding domain-containing protein [Oceanispirochaeta sp. M1]RDG29294.1 MBL fold metallo-hydrolase [Oceanispirochaeta sp. M1]